MSSETHLASRRLLIASGAFSMAAAALARTAPGALAQTDRALLDMLFVLEQIEVVHFAAILDSYPEERFASDGFPDGARAGIETILHDDSVHLARLARPEGDPLPPPIAPGFTSLDQALRGAIELKTLTSSAYAGVIPPMGRPGIIADLIGIHAVEARHTAWLSTILGENPFPNAIDPTLAPTEVLARLEAMAQEESGATPVAGETLPAALVAAIAQDLGVSVEEVEVVTVERREWPDASLGCPRPGHVYADVITPGYLVIARAGSEQREYHTDDRGNVTRCP